MDSYICGINTSPESILLRLNKKRGLFLGHRRICFKSPALLFFLFLSKKEKEKKTLFQFLNIIIGQDHVVSLGRCGPLPVMLASLFILDSISGISSIKKFLHLFSAE